MTLKLRQGQVWKHGSEFIRIVKLERLEYSHQELELLLEASKVCPMRAFRLESEDGQVYSLPEDDAVRVALKSGNYRWAESATGPRGLGPVA